VRSRALREVVHKTLDAFKEPGGTKVQNETEWTSGQPQVRLQLPKMDPGVPIQFVLGSKQHDRLGAESLPRGKQPTFRYCVLPRTQKLQR
jgi:hypothetical protein